MKKLDPLTSLRFLAALAIVVEHSKAAFHATSWITAPLPFDYGVSFFFVLSGFILTYSHRSMESLADAYRFYIARFARIWPLHLATFLLCLAVISKGAWFVGNQSGHWLRISTANILLLHAWIPSPGFFFSFNSVSWSISAEVFFYLMFPILRHRWSTTWHWKSLLVLVVSCAILTLATARGVPDADFSQPMEISSTGIAYISPFVRIVEFVTGMLVASVFIRFQDSNRGGRISWTAAEFVAVGLIPAMWVLTRSLPVRLAGHDLGASAWPIFAAHCGAFPAFALMIFVMAFGRGALSGALSWRPLVLLGEASFALYLVHQLIISYFYLNRPMFNRVPDAVLLVAYWSICIGSAFALWHFIEKPARNHIRGLLTTTSRPPSPRVATQVD